MKKVNINKNNKIKLILLSILILFVAISGITYAYFSIQVVGNEEASSIRVSTATLSLIYNDVEIVSGETVSPGWSQTKTLTVENDGTVDVEYIIKWREIQNTIINGELVISATCTSNIQGNTCANIPETPVPTALSEITNAYVFGPVPIEVGEIHTYTLTATLNETGSNQNYNQNKSFHGTLNIGDGTSTDENLFAYTTSNNQVTITGFNDHFEVVDSDKCLSYWNTNNISQSCACNGNLVCNASDYNAVSCCSTTIKQYILNNVPSSDYEDAGIYSDSMPTNLIIPSSINQKPVVSIAARSFNLSSLTSVVIPSSVTTIGDYAFSNNQLTSITIPNGVTSVGASAFAYNQLTSLSIPNSVTSVGANAFHQNLLSSVTLSNNTPNIQYSTFINNRLTSVIIPEGVTYIGSYAFTNNQLTSAIISSSASAISNYAFSTNQLTSVRIKGKSSSTDFTSYGSDIWGWASGVTCVTNNTSNVTNGCITWEGSES